MISSSLLFCSLVATALATPTVTSATSASSVLTPAGLRPANSAHEIPADAKIQYTVNGTQVLDADGNVLFSASAPAGGAPTVGHKTSSGADPLETGWIAYAYWTNDGAEPINAYEATWTVPPVPVSWDGQTLFYFNSIEPASGDAILQPVLQYGESSAGGGEYWSIATWWLDPSTTLFTPLVEVQPGQSLQGIIELETVGDGVYNYASGFVGQQALSIQSSEELVWATITLEVYAVQSLSDFPGTTTTFTDISIGTSAGTPDVFWSTVDDTADGIDANVVVNNGVNGEITITY